MDVTKDLFGIEIKVGDYVVFGNAQDIASSLDIGRVIETPNSVNNDAMLVLEGKTSIKFRILSITDNKYNIKAADQQRPGLYKGCEGRFLIIDPIKGKEIEDAWILRCNKNNAIYEENLEKEMLRISKMTPKELRLHNFPHLHYGIRCVDVDCGNLSHIELKDGEYV